jgi:hypothetical protein
VRATRDPRKDPSEPRTPAPAPAAEAPLRELIALQRSAGNAVVARALLARVGGWKGGGVDPKSPNAGEMTVTEKGGKSARRIPIQGIPEGNVADDLQDTASQEKVEKDGEKKTINHPVSERTSESAAGGRAIVIIPTGIPLSEKTELDVLVHLHGHTTGMRKSGKTTRDLGAEHIEEQVAAAAAGRRPLIAVLPQGKFHSSFGRKGKSFDPTDYLDSVWKILGDIGAWDDKDKPPKRGGLMLSSHSGGDAALEDMLGKGEKAGKGEVADLEGLFLLDTMYGSSDAAKIVSFVKFRIGRDMTQLSDMKKAGKTENERVKWIKEHGFRLRLAHSGGHYKPQMTTVENAVIDFLGQVDQLQAIGIPGTPLHTAYRGNLSIDASTASGSDHLNFLGENENLRKSLEMMP